MKCRLVCAVALFITCFNAHSHAQSVVLSQNFGTGLVSSQCSDQPFPADWTRYNVDGRTPDAQVAYVNNAWIVREDFDQDVTNCVAFSTSYYSPVGQADDWLVTPAFVVPATAPEVRFITRAYDATYPDGFEVRWATTNSVAAFLANPPLLTVVAEATSWTPHTIGLSALAGQTIYLAFRNHSVDKFLLVLDDIQVISVLAFDGAITSVTAPYDLLRMPVTQGYPLRLGGTIQNTGTQALTNLVLTAHVMLNGTEIHTAASVPLVSLAPAASAVVTIPPIAATQLGTVSVQYTLTVAESDQNTANNTATSSSLIVTTTELAGDDAVATGILGIGSGTGGYIGNAFHLERPAYVKAIRYYTAGTNADLVGNSIVGEIRSMTSKPGAQIAATQPYVVPNPPASGFVDLLFAPAQFLAAGDYYFGLIEPVFDPGQNDTLDLGVASSEFVVGRGWVNWPSNPSGDWSNLEDFGSDFSIPLMVRVLLASNADLSVSKTASPSPVAAGSALTYTIVVANGGPDAATDVVVTDPLPPGVTFVSASGTGWNCSESAGTVTCTATELSVGSAPPITIVVTAPNSDTVLSNTATVTTSSHDPDGATETVTTPVFTTADLALSKTGPPAIVVGTNISYDVVVINNGPDGATNVTLTDTAPAGTTFVSVLQNTGPAFTCSGSLTCTIATLPANASAAFTLVFQVNADVADGTLLTNTANVSSMTVDSNPADNTAQSSATVNAADLAITKIAPASVAQGHNATYDITLTNIGSADALNVTFTDVLPAGTTFVSSQQNTGPVFNCVSPAPGATGSVTCTAASLAAGTAASFTIVAQVAITTPSGTVITNTATASSATADPVPLNNSSSASTSVTGGDVNLSITTTASDPPYGTGLPVTFTIVVVNGGASDAGAVIVTDVIPVGASFVSATPSQGSCAGTSTVTCTLGTIPNGGSATILLELTLPETPGPLSNTATVTTANPEVNPADNTATANITVVAAAAEIPTLSPFAFMLLAAALALFAAVRLR